MDSITRSPEANLLLMQMRRFQSDLFTHAVNVCVLSLVVATLEELADDLSALGMAALLHDVGEMRLPRTLIRKRNGFTEAEQRLIEQHPMLGAALLSQCEDVPALVRHIVIEHHERIDGSGYPVGSRGAEVSRYSQIVAIADTYDDMLSGRNQIAHQPTEVLRQLYLQANAGALDLDLVEKVIRGLGVYPIGSLVELSSGERAIVLVADRSDTIKPIVRIIVSRTGMKQLNGPIVSLAESGSVAADRRIVNVLDPRKEGIDPMAFLKIAPALAG
jgi:putative nucleotidyltransferase with HDIG domain